MISSIRDIPDLNSCLGDRRSIKALENGAEALLTKPLDFGALRGEIDARIELAA